MASAGGEDFSDYYVVPSLAGTEAGDTRSARKASPAWRKVYAKPILARGQCPNPGVHLQRGGFDPGTLAGFGPGSPPSMLGAGVKLFVMYVAIQVWRGKPMSKWMTFPGMAMAVWAYVDELRGLYQNMSGPSAPGPGTPAEE